MWTDATRRRGLVFGAAALLGGAVVTLSGVSLAQQGTPTRHIVKIALPGFNAESGDTADLARQVTALITDDLRSAGRLTLIDSATLPAISVDSVPSFDAWRALGIEGLIIGGVRTTADGRVRAQFRLWDVTAGTTLRGAQYFTVPEHWQQLAHVIAGAVHQQLTGEERDFETPRD